MTAITHTKILQKATIRVSQRSEESFVYAYLIWEDGTQLGFGSPLRYGAVEQARDEYKKNPRYFESK